MNQNTYRTTSLSLAAAIHTVAPSTLETLSQIPESRQAEFIFGFSNGSEIENIIAKFWDKELKVDALSYFESLKYLKSRLYEGRS